MKTKKKQKDNTNPYEFEFSRMEESARKRTEIKHSLVHQLRAPIRRMDDEGSPHVGDLTNKINAIGEALAYLIDKKKSKRALKRIKQRGG